MQRGDKFYVEFRAFHVILDALKAEGLKPDRDFTID